MKLIDESGIRIDGREPDMLRPMEIEIRPLRRANGSALVKLGKTEVLAAVYGPREVHPRHLALPDRAIVRCSYRLAPFSTTKRKSIPLTRREVEISEVLREALESLIILEHFPRTSIDVFIEVLQADGGTRCAGLVAASLALADAGIPIKDLASACAVGKINGRIVLDLNELEDMYGDADMAVGYIPSSDEILLLQMGGSFTPEEFKQALDLAINGCKQIYEFQKKALKDKYAFSSYEKSR